MLSLFLGTTVLPSISAEPYDASAFGNPFMFTGQRHDSDFGLHHFYARSYSPELGGR